MLLLAPTTAPHDDTDGEVMDDIADVLLTTKSKAKHAQYVLVLNINALLVVAGIRLLLLGLLVAIVRFMVIILYFSYLHVLP